MSTRFFLAAMSLLLGAGCAGMTQRIQPIDTVDTDYRPPGQTGHGLVIASTRFTNDCKEGEAPSMDLVFVPEAYSDEPPGLIPLTGPADKRDFQNPPGYLLVREVRSGGHYFRYLVTNVFRTQLPRPIHFPVEEGKAFYLGEIHLSYVNCQGNGPSVRIQTRDEWERDRQVLQKKLPNLRPEDVVKRVLPANWR